MKKILVAEDEQTLREGIVTAFKDRGWQVTEAGDGAEAMERLENEVFDVLVTDYKMPERSGLEVLKRCKMINEGTVGVVMTAYGTVESAVEVMKAGAYDYVLKPFELEELELKVERALEHRRMLQRNLLYTAVSRARRLVVLAGSRDALQQGVDNNVSSRRYTGLVERLQSELPPV